MSEEGNKSSCGISIELLSAFIDNELDEQEYRRIKEHLKSCVHCQKIVVQFKEMDEQIRRMELEEPSREFIFNLKKNVLEKIGKKPKFVLWRFFPILIPAAAAILVLIVFSNEGLETPVGMNNRVPYVYEEKNIKDEKIDISLPATTPIAESKPRVETHLDKKIAAPTPKTTTRHEDLESRAYASESAVPKISEPVVIRAIVDSTGKIINVARGKSLTPEEDTTISRILKGKQIAPPKIQGRPTQMFVEFNSEDKDSN